MKSINSVVLAAVIAWAGMAADARADLILSLENQADGGDSVVLAPGGSFTLDVVVTGPDEFMSAILDLAFASSGLVATDYLWNEMAFETGGADEFTTLDMEGVPFTIDELLHFENLTKSGMTFDEGVLLSLTLMVPESFSSGPSQVTIMPDQFTLDGFEFIPTTAAGPFTISIAGSTGGGGGGGGGGGSDPDPGDDDPVDNTNDNGSDDSMNDNGMDDDGDLIGNDNGSGDDDGMSDADGMGDEGGMTDADDGNGNTGGGMTGNTNSNGNTSGEGGGAPGTMCAMGMIHTMMLALAGLCGLRSARRRLLRSVRLPVRRALSSRAARGPR